MAPKYKYRYADGTIGDSPWKKGADGKHLLNREGGFLEEGSYVGWVNDEGEIIPGTPPGAAASSIMGYSSEDPSNASTLNTPATETPKVEAPVAAPPPIATAPAKLSWFDKLVNWFMRLFS